MKRCLSIVGAICVVLAALYLAAPFVLNYLGNRLIVSDPLVKADAIVVLAGDSNGERVTTGVQLFRLGFAPYILMSGGPLSWQLTFAEWMKKQALAGGVPAGRILLQDRSQSTLEDAKFSLPIVERHGFRSIILVTSPQHTRRAGRVFRKVFGRAGIKVIVRPAARSAFNPDHWWRRYEDRALVVWEYLASVLYWLKGY
ncbi:MAG TPA: YdcF family protein [Candidatus Sulfotelmatobacter sp.]|nr:YdcF family protein [Candidatus Sulfotelmatobacter sp.]